MGRTLAAQLYVHDHEVFEAKIAPVHNDPDELSKPRGGFWTSTYHPDYGSAWVCWCVAHRYNEPVDLQWTLLRPTQSARIAVIDSVADLSVLIDQYPRTLHGQLGLDFEHLSDDFDAVQLTNECYLATRSDETGPALAGWDCESTLWFRWVFIEHAAVKPYFKDFDHYDRLWHELSGWSASDAKCHLLPGPETSAIVFEQILKDMAAHGQQIRV